MAGTDLTTAVAVEVAKQLPIKDAYGDILSPAAKQAGGLVEDLAKTIRLALAPLQYTAALQDRYVNFLNRSVRRVPDEQRISPPPQILGPVLEGVKYESADTPLSDMFSQLLSRAFDREHVSEAHPSYPALIRQLSTDEAILLQAFYARELSGAYLNFQWKMDFDQATNMFSNRVVEVDDLPRDLLVFPKNADFYMERLGVLGLAGVPQIGNQEPLADTSNRQIGIRAKHHIRLTPSGLRFMAAVSERPSD
ncbi:Abi-alpha family protein [Devosia sp.]|uniref:Abi-alpha family protein n=1 Tax=Devosia sp. TaxID=1871048 RepID=UPI0025FBF6BC|nr:Abi-alpha family protein [Devosia sp.]MCR6635171.1 DUF4393 domain-containing protein [Devosia sp.]